MKHLVWMIVLGVVCGAASASAEERGTKTTQPGKTTTTAADVQTAPPATTTSVRDLPTTETTSPVNRPLLVSGTLLLGGTYAASAAAAYRSARPEDQKYLYLPLAGPWLDLAHRDTLARPAGGETINKALLVIDGVGQGLGALMMISSLFVPEKTTQHWYLVGDDEVHGGPMAIGTGYGLGAAGRF
jgi:hypothetical protein